MEFSVMATTGRLLTREAWRRTARRIRSGTLTRLTVSGASPEGLSLAPQSLMPADAKRAVAFYEGVYEFAGQRVVMTGASPFVYTAEGTRLDDEPEPDDQDPPGPAWFDELHGFAWLCHLDRANTDLARAHAAALVADWISLWGQRQDNRAWRTDIVAKRLIAFIDHSPLLVTKTSIGAYRLLLRTMGQHVRFLARNGPFAREGSPRLICAIAQLYGALCLKGMERNVDGAERELDRQLARQVLSNDAPLLRKPAALLQTLSTMLPLQQVYRQQEREPSPGFNRACTTMMEALRLLRHTDGTLARFNGMGETDTGLLANVLRRREITKDKDETPPPQSVAGGFHRLELGGTVVIVDAGRPNRQCGDGWAMAGTLGFEMSSGDARFIVNCGAPSRDFELYAPYARATAAHSTAVVADASSSVFAGNTRLHRHLPSPIIRPPKRVEATRKSSDAWQEIEASHDGYLARFGITHHRRLTLDDNGRTLQGTDRFEYAGKSEGPVPAVLRFHLPVSVKASQLASGHTVLLAKPGSQAWTFSCIDAPLSIEESVQFSAARVDAPGAAQGPRTSRQIVLMLDDVALDGGVEVRWMMERDAGHTPVSTAPPETTGDLLDGLASPDTPPDPEAD